jgi:uncharacterized protein YdeI (YjbR/CyaY-like superfamily)
MKVVYFETSADFHRWLKTNGQAQSELWVGFYKKSSGKRNITYPEALDEALCWGWIDGVRKSVALDAYTSRFTPRKPKSQWSAVNIRHVERLMKAGRMTPAGLKAFEGAKDQSRKYSFEQKEEPQFDPEGKRKFRANSKAWAFFQSQPSWYRRTATFWVMSAKKEETRQRRLETLIADSESGKSIKPLTRPVPKRNEKGNRTTV